MSLQVIKTHEEEAQNLLKDGWKPSGGSNMVKHPLGAQLRVAPPVASLMRALDGMSTAEPKLGRKPKAKGTRQGAMTVTRQIILAEVVDAVRDGEFLREYNARQLIQVLARRMEKSIRGRVVMRKLREATNSQQRKINKAMVIQIILDATRQQPSEAEGTAMLENTAAVVSIQGTRWLVAERQQEQGREDHDGAPTREQCSRRFGQRHRGRGPARLGARPATPAGNAATCERGVVPA